MSELAKLFAPKDFFTDKLLASSSDYYLSGELLDPTEYIEWFEYIRSAGEHETITIHINSHGGNLYTAIQFIHVMKESRAHIIASIEGACMSAATLICLHAHEFIISNYSTFMFHNYSGGAIGKGGEMADQIVFEKKWSELMFKEIYKGFLTVKEIEAMLDGKDLWMSGSEVANRLNEKINKTTEKPVKSRVKSKTAET